MVKYPPASAGDVRGAVLIPGSGKFPGGGHGNPLQHVVWRIPWTEEPRGLQSIGLQRGGHDRDDLARIPTDTLNTQRCFLESSVIFLSCQL